MGRAERSYDAVLYGRALRMQIKSRSARTLALGICASFKQGRLNGCAGRCLLRQDR